MANASLVPNDNAPSKTSTRPDPWWPKPPTGPRSDNPDNAPYKTSASAPIRFRLAPGLHSLPPSTNIDDMSTDYDPLFDGASAEAWGSPGGPGTSPSSVITAPLGPMGPTAARADALRQSAGTLLANLPHLASADLFDLMVTLRQEVARRALAHREGNGEGNGRRGKAGLAAAGADPHADKWERLLQDTELTAFNEAKAFQGLKEIVLRIEKAAEAKMTTTSRMLSEVNSQLEILPLLRGTIARNGQLTTLDPKEVRDVTSTINSALTLLMRFQADLVDAERQQKIEEALIEVGRELPPPQAERFLKGLEARLGEVVG